MNNPADAPHRVYDGNCVIGALKELRSGGVEVFVARKDGDLVYQAKALNRREAIAMVHKCRARPEGAPPAQAAE